MAVKVLAFAGSLRRESLNKRLVRIAQRGAEQAGAQVTFIDLKDYELPIFDQDYEDAHGLPDNGRKLKDLFLEHRGLLIACPEYNSGITAVLKNTIDWVSRPAAGEAPLGCFDGKVAGLVSASTGALGGLRGLPLVRLILSNIKVTVLPQQVAVPKAHEQLTADGNLKDAGLQQQVEGVGAAVARVAGQLAGK